MAGQIILSVAYGIDVRPEGDPFVEDAEKVLQAVILGSTPEATIFDSVTWCNIYPFPPLYLKNVIFTDATRSTPYAELVSRSTLQTLCARVGPHRRQCAAKDIRQGEGRSCEFLRVFSWLVLGVRAVN
jgi:hypothetical protein